MEMASRVKYKHETGLCGEYYFAGFHYDKLWFAAIVLIRKQERNKKQPLEININGLDNCQGMIGSRDGSSMITGASRCEPYSKTRYRNKTTRY